MTLEAQELLARCFGLVVGAVIVIVAVAWYDRLKDKREDKRIAAWERMVSEQPGQENKEADTK